MSASRRHSTRTLVYISLFVALTSVMAQIAIPMPGGVPITLQTFAVAFAGFCLGWKAGLASIAAYLFLGLTGAPVFSAFNGGVGVLAGPSGGFIVGFLPFAALCGLGRNGRVIAAFSGACGLVVCHLIGAGWFSVLTGVGFEKALLVASVPFLVKDAISVFAAYFVARAVQKRLHVFPSSAEKTSTPFLRGGRVLPENR